jgi:hypothetical protein
MEYVVCIKIGESKWHAKKTVSKTGEKDATTPSIFHHTL